MIDFQRPDLSRREEYEKIFHSFGDRGCEYSFPNLYMWGRQTAAMLHGCLVGFSHYHGRSVYPMPVGSGDVKAALDAVMADADQRGIPFRVTCLVKSDLELLESWYPGKFQFRCERDNFDYVYDIHKLADLKGRKYQQKRNHIHRFQDAVPEARVVVLDESTLDLARSFSAEWYALREAENPHMDFHMEKIAICRALRDFRGLGMEGILLMDGDKPVAMTMGSFLSDTIFDVHFEKAAEEIPGAYAAINQEFARYLREKYPALQLLNREDDLGIEGLRKAKLSYQPEYLVEKYWAHPKEDGYDF